MRVGVPDWEANISVHPENILDLDRPMQVRRMAALAADPTRAEILTTLMDGRAHTGGELARHVGVAPSTASEHLAGLSMVISSSSRPEGAIVTSPWQAQTWPRYSRR